MKRSFVVIIIVISVLLAIIFGIIIIFNISHTPPAPNSDLFSNMQEDYFTPKFNPSRCQNNLIDDPTVFHRASDAVPPLEQPVQPFINYASGNPNNSFINRIEARPQQLFINQIEARPQQLFINPITSYPTNTIVINSPKKNMLTNRSRNLTISLERVPNANNRTRRVLERTPVTISRNKKKLQVNYETFKVPEPPTIPIDTAPRKIQRSLTAETTRVQRVPLQRSLSAGMNNCLQTVQLNKNILSGMMVDQNLTPEKTLNTQQTVDLRNVAISQCSMIDQKLTLEKTPNIQQTVDLRNVTISECSMDPMTRFRDDSLLEAEDKNNLLFEANMLDIIRKGNEDKVPTTTTNQTSRNSGDTDDRRRQRNVFLLSLLEHKETEQ